MKMRSLAKPIAISVALAAPALLGACAQQAAAPLPPPPPPSRVAATDVRVATATVVAIDHKTRRVTLRDELGNPLPLTVGPEVKNLAQVKRGDRVTARYYESLAAELKKPGEAGPGLSVREGGATAEPGQRPGGAKVRETKGTVTIVSVDTANDRVTFTGPRGATRTVRVRTDEGRRFASQLKPGDKVELTYTEALAVAVEPAQ